MLKTEYFFASVLILKFPHSANIPPVRYRTGVCLLFKSKFKREYRLGIFAVLNEERVTSVQTVQRD